MPVRPLKNQLHHWYNLIYERIPSSLFCRLINLRNKLRGKQHRLSPVAHSPLYKVTDTFDQQIIICRRDRHNLYKRGITDRVNKLAAVYHLNHIECTAGDVIIDCGANIGELGIWANKRNLHYVPVEPEELEVRCCNLNISTGKTETKCRALWKENASLQLYSKPDSADSSLYEVPDYTAIKTVQAQTLDSLLAENNINKVHILKIEAEGAEPEILYGAEHSLHKVNYVTVDCGYEKGINKEHTFIEVNNILLRHGFSLLQAELRRGTMLYQRQNKLGNTPF